jgi:hypothetical protein
MWLDAVRSGWACLDMDGHGWIATWLELGGWVARGSADEWPEGLGLSEEYAAWLADCRQPLSEHVVVLACSLSCVSLISREGDRGRRREIRHAHHLHVCMFVYMDNM